MINADGIYYVCDAVLRCRLASRFPETYPEEQYEFDLGKKYEFLGLRISPIYSNGIPAYKLICDADALQVEVHKPKKKLMFVSKEPDLSNWRWIGDAWREIIINEEDERYRLIEEVLSEAEPARSFNGYFGSDLMAEMLDTLGIKQPEKILKINTDLSGVFDDSENLPYISSFLNLLQENCDKKRALELAFLNNTHIRSKGSVERIELIERYVKSLEESGVDLNGVYIFAYGSTSKGFARDVVRNGHLIRESDVEITVLDLYGNLHKRVIDDFNVFCKENGFKGCEVGSEYYSEIPYENPQGLARLFLYCVRGGYQELRKEILQNISPDEYGEMLFPMMQMLTVDCAKHMSTFASLVEMKSDSEVYLPQEMKFPTTDYLMGIAPTYEEMCVLYSK